MQSRVPNVDTTYWCEAMKLPPTVLQNEKYIVKVHMCMLCQDDGKILVFSSYYHWQ